MDRLALYHNLKYELQENQEPQMHFYNLKGDVVKSLPVLDMTADEISGLLESLGFYKKPAKGEEVPERFRNFPLKAAREEL